MLDFITSVPWFGWVLISLLIFTLWQMPLIYRQWRERPADTLKMHPGEDPPTHGAGWH
ncbi:hypothetical protein [Tateyamaria sp.]|uniref:hypothetical protein n=1 Tax=Tateyamaria sp. TaxID=1929288 RepID=UPI003B21337A